MSKVATILGLAAAAAASASAPPAYGASSAAPAYSAAAPAYSSAAAGYGSSSSAAVGYPSASASASPYGSSSSGAWPVSSSMSTSYGYPSSASSYYPSSSSAAPTSPPFPICWSECFQENHISSESEVCGDEAVSTCIHSTCDCADTWSYFSWYNSYCEAPTTSSSVSSSAYGYTTSASSSAYGYSSSASSSAYGYASYSVSTATSSAASETPSSPIDQCWSSCFASNGVTSEESLCGNSAVSACIHDTCSAAEDQAYWAWYDSYCVATSTGTTTVTTVCTPLSTPYGPVTTTYVSTETYGWAPVTTGATTLPSPPSSPAAPWTGWTAPATSAATAGPTATGYSPPAQSTWAPVPATGAGAMTKPGVFFAAAMALAALF